MLRLENIPQGQQCGLWSMIAKALHAVHPPLWHVADMLGVIAAATAAQGGGRAQPQRAVCGSMGCSSRGMAGIG